MPPPSYRLGRNETVPLSTAEPTDCIAHPLVVPIDHLGEQSIVLRTLFTEGERIHTENSYKFTVEGLRTLAANVAVEMPESEVGGSHYRVLFLSALVLLLFTFVMNTLAELIRQRLRKKYSSL